MMLKEFVIERFDKQLYDIRIEIITSAIDFFSTLDDKE